VYDSNWPRQSCGESASSSGGHPVSSREVPAVSSRLPGCRATVRHGAFVAESAIGWALSGADPSHNCGLAMPERVRGLCPLESAAGLQSHGAARVRKPAVEVSACGRAPRAPSEASPSHDSVRAMPEQARYSCCPMTAARLQSPVRHGVWSPAVDESASGRAPSGANPSLDCRQTTPEQVRISKCHNRVTTRHGVRGAAGSWLQPVRVV
jgi:hypothetical protein